MSSQYGTKGQGSRDIRRVEKRERLEMRGSDERKGNTGKTRRTEGTASIGDIGLSGRGAREEPNVTSRIGGIARFRKRPYRGRYDTYRTSPERNSSHVVTGCLPTWTPVFSIVTIRSLIETTSIALTLPGLPEPISTP